MSLLEEKSTEINNYLYMLRDSWNNELEKLDEVIAESEKIIQSDEGRSDRSENATFSSAVEAKELASQNKAQLIRKLNLLNDSTVDVLSSITSGYIPEGYAKLGSTCHILLTETSKEYFYKLVPKGLGAPRAGAIHITSSLGRSLLNKKKGDTFTASATAGEWTYKVIDIL